MFGRSKRQELYDRIRESSKDEVILEEMVRLGFWPRKGEIPQDPAAEIKRRGELQRSLQKLREKQWKLGSEAAMKKELLKQRLAESRRKKAENKRNKLDARKARAHAHELRKREHLDYLGEGISAGLQGDKSDLTLLGSQGLPKLSTAKELADATGLEVGHLRYLTFHRKVSRTSHYVRFKLPKKTGGERLISAPMPRLKWLQEWILRNVLEPVPSNAHAHGFRPGRSIVTNAEAHVGAKVVVNIDLSNFFPTVTYKRVKGLFRALGYSEQLATIFALACTEPDVAEVEIDGKKFYVQQGERHLPQGSPASPAITNLICRRLDARVAALAKALDFTFTRYADDFTFSTTVAAPHIGKLLGRLNRVVKDEGFRIHRKKTRVLRSGRRQEVTGLVINDGRVTVPRTSLRRFRALLFQIERDGPDGKRWGASTNVLSAIHGFASFVMMVDRDKGIALMTRVKKILDAQGAKAPKKTTKRPVDAARDVLFRPIPVPREPEPEPVPPPPKQSAASKRAVPEYAIANIWKRIAAKIGDVILLALTIWGFSRYFSANVGMLVGYGWLLIADWNSITKPRLGMKVVMAKDGAPCTLAGTIMRNVAFVGALAMVRLTQTSSEAFRAVFIVLLIAVVVTEVWVGVTSKDGTRWGDQLAGTRVIPVEPPEQPAETAST